MRGRLWPTGRETGASSKRQNPPAGWLRCGGGVARLRLLIGRRAQRVMHTAPAGGLSRSLAKDRADGRYFGLLAGNETASRLGNGFQPFPGGYTKNESFDWLLASWTATPPLGQRMMQRSEECCLLWTEASHGCTKWTGTSRSQSLPPTPRDGSLAQNHGWAARRTSETAGASRAWWLAGLGYFRCSGGTMAAGWRAWPGRHHAKDAAGGQRVEPREVGGRTAADETLALERAASLVDRAPTSQRAVWMITTDERRAGRF